MPATFILAPMAIALREQGENIKIVYLGHRDGSRRSMVHKDSQIFRMHGFARGKTRRRPESLFANQRLHFFPRAEKRQHD